MTSCWRSQSPTVVSSSGFEIDSPALLTTRSTPPNARTARRNASTICASSVTSAARLIAVSVPPSSRATASALSGSMSATTTQAPSAASRWAIALPIPDPAPVTNATRAASGFGFGIRGQLRFLERPVLDPELLRLGDRAVGGHGLGAAHHIDRIDVELAGDARRLLVRPEREHPDPRHQHDRGIRAAHRRAVRRGVALVVGAVVARDTRRGAHAAGEPPRRGRRPAEGRGPSAGSSFEGSGPGTTCRAPPGADAPSGRRSRARHRCPCSDRPGGDRSTRDRGSAAATPPRGRGAQARAVARSPESAGRTGPARRCR